MSSPIVLNKISIEIRDAGVNYNNIVEKMSASKILPLDITVGIGSLLHTPEATRTSQQSVE